MLNTAAKRKRIQALFDKTLSDDTHDSRFHHIVKQPDFSGHNQNRAIVYGTEET